MPRTPPMHSTTRRNTTVHNLTAARAAADLVAVREQWGDLLAAIERPPVSEWPPRDSRALGVTADDDEPAEVGRPPLILRKHPAPANLDALDAALTVERSLFELADAVAAVVQRPVRRVRKVTSGGRTIVTVDGADHDDPARWHYQSQTGPGSRTYGLHWAAVWIEGRILGEGTVTPRPSNTVRLSLFRPLPVLLLDEAASIARSARRTVERALSRDGRTVELDDVCPWCAGALTGRTQPGGEPVVSCATGPGCGAPAVLDRGRRTWRGAELVGLWGALDLARRRGQPVTV